MMYQKLMFPLLSRVDAELVHEHTLVWLERVQNLAVGRAVLRLMAGRVPHKPVEVLGLTFPNVLGLAAGFDKDVRVAVGLACLGFGHVEVGTLTPRPQAGNPRPRVFRLKDDNALINRMGFPNGGVETAVSRLKKLSELRGVKSEERKAPPFILGVSLGKQKETPLADAAQDYMAVMEAVYPYADYLAVNISSPNTPGLRELQGGDYLGSLMGQLQATNNRLSGERGVKKRPLLVKIAPDLAWQEVDEIITAVLHHHIDGIIATNTTLSREGLTDPHKNETGGLSGQPLAARSTEIIAYIARQTAGKLPIIGVGGIHTVAEAQAKLDAGSSLLQLYTALVYEGPGVARRILQGLRK